MEWADLTAEQQLVLLNAVEESYLFTVLLECTPGQEWQEKLAWVPHLAQVVEDLIKQGLVSVTRDGPVASAEPIDIPPGEVHELLADPENWWSPNGVRPFALAPTDEGRAIFRA